MVLSILLAAVSLFTTTPVPMEMPRAEAYLVRERGEGGRDYVNRLEDRYAMDELWLNRVIVGRWIDADFRVFTLASLDCTPPALAAADTLTRMEYEVEISPIDRRDEKALRRAIAGLSPFELPEKAERARQIPRFCEDVRYWHGTNTAAIVCAFRPERSRNDEKSPNWLLAIWELAPEDDQAEKIKLFEEFFLEKREYSKLIGRKLPEMSKFDERNLLRRDAAKSIVAYDEWHFTSSEELIVLDDLSGSAKKFASAVTNEIPALRRSFAQIIPSPLDGSNTLAVARIFSNRDDYLEAAGEDMQWSAAYWNPLRRELVACLPPGGDTAQLLRTMRHESFHQYLSYATSMIPVSPWLNEGYAQYFEAPENLAEKAVAPAIFSKVNPPDWDELEHALPSLFFLDYNEFYAGTDSERNSKYRLAYSIAVFLEQGASDVRFDPFKNLKKDYMAELIKSRDMHQATEKAFGSMDKLRLFANEWKKFWKKQ